MPTIVSLTRLNICCSRFWSRPQDKVHFHLLEKTMQSVDLSPCIPNNAISVSYLPGSNTITPAALRSNNNHLLGQLTMQYLKNMQFVDVVFKSSSFLVIRHSIYMQKTNSFMVRLFTHKLALEALNQPLEHQPPNSHPGRHCPTTNIIPPSIWMPRTTSQGTCTYWPTLMQMIIPIKCKVDLPESTSPRKRHILESYSTGNVSQVVATVCSNSQ